MHIDLLSIAFLPINNRRYEHQCVLGHEVPYASISSCVCCEIKLECPGERQDGKGQEGVEEGSTCHNGRLGGGYGSNTADCRMCWGREVEMLF